MSKSKVTLLTLYCVHNFSVALLPILSLLWTTVSPGQQNFEQESQNFPFSEEFRCFHGIMRSSLLCWPLIAFISNSNPSSVCETFRQKPLIFLNRANTLAICKTPLLRENYYTDNVYSMIIEHLIQRGIFSYSK